MLFKTIITEIDLPKSISISIPIYIYLSSQIFPLEEEYKPQALGILHRSGNYNIIQLVSVISTVD